MLTDNGEKIVFLGRQPDGAFFVDYDEQNVLKQIASNKGFEFFKIKDGTTPRLEKLAIEVSPNKAPETEQVQIKVGDVVIGEATVFTEAEKTRQSNAKEKVQKDIDDAARIEQEKRDKLARDNLEKSNAAAANRDRKIAEALSRKEETATEAPA